MPESPPDALSDSSLEWALKNVRRFGDTDIFPVPFEYQCIAADWPSLKPYLQTVSLSNWTTRALFRTLVPKHHGGFRVATQLDPLDSLIYCSIIHEAAEDIEKSRVSSERACSYRLAPAADGTLFSSQEGGWSDFQIHSRRLVADKSVTYVLTADLADFYSHASHHRIENALETANINRLRAGNVEALLGGLNANHHSRGIPVGPYPSIVLAEICLNDVDMFLLRKGLVHVRYVDDFRVFCRSYGEALRALHDLTEYLFTAHRLALQTNKTRIWRVANFRSHELHDPAEQEAQSKEERLAQLLNEIEYTTGYPALVDELEAEALRQVDAETLGALFERLVQGKPIHIGTARYLLRKASTLRSRVILPQVVANLPILVPVFRDVALYLSRVLNDEAAKTFGDRIAAFFESSEHGALPFVRTWAFALIQRRPALMTGSRAMALADSSFRDLGIRPAALMARTYGYLDWARAEKEKWSGYGSWDRRAVIWASAVLPQDERGHWLEAVKGRGDYLDSAVAKLAAAGVMKEAAGSSNSGG